MAIGGGELAHPGDVVATRRNHRQLVTTNGEPVRNRDTWTVTAVHPDGDLTVSHLDGHGTITLPVDYVRQFVRLGYAATEHGYESDTVTTSIELASPATTRRGLYVAATRGRDQNLICVITDTPDVAEAREVLERILAVDRADIPAVTQRRELARAARPPLADRRVEQPRPRCEIPDWFHTLHRQTRHDLDSAQRTADTNTAERNRLHTELDKARQVLDHIDPATRAQRDQLAAAEDEAREAEWDHAAAERRLDHRGLLGRRDARRDLAAAANRLTWANHHLDQTQALVGPDVERYTTAWTRTQNARADLHHHDTVALLDRYTIDQIPALERRLAALDSWRRWANGDTINVQQLGPVVGVLTGAHGDHAGHYRTLGHALQLWARSADIDLRAQKPSNPALERPGIELEL